MEKEEQKMEQAEVEEQEAAETTPLVRKSRNGDDSKIFAISDVDNEVSINNGVSLTNGHTVQTRIVENEAEEQKIEEVDWILENKSEAINGEHKREERDGVLENAPEARNGEKNSENLVFHDKIEGIWKCRMCTWTYGTGSVCVDHLQNHRGVLHNFMNVKTLNFVSQGVNPISTYVCKTLILDKGISSSNVQPLPSDISSREGVDSTSTYIIREPILKGPAKYDVSSLDLHIEFNGTSVVNNQHEEEIGENSISSSNVPSSPSSISSQEGVDSTSTYIITEQILKGPAIYDVSSLDLAPQSNGSVTNNQYEEEEIEDKDISSSNVQPSPSNISSREGVDSTSTYIITEQILKGPAIYDVSSLGLTPRSNGTSVINNQYKEGEIDDNGISSSNIQHSDSYEPSKEIESAETDMIDEDDLEITELDVERVIKKQTTHDLYCPNCKSCITKRVILSKRKRRIRIPAEEVKRPKTETATGPDLATASTLSPEDDAQIPTIDEEERDRGPDVFRCLSCFSIFIPSGDGFKLFRIFGDKSGKENVRDEQAPNVRKNWFSNIFKPNKQETVFEQASYSAIPSSDPAHQSGEPSVLQYTGSEGVEGTTGKTGTFPNLKPSVNGIVTNGGKGKLDVQATQTVDATKFDMFTADQLMESNSSQDEVHIGRDIFLSTTLQNTEKGPKANQLVQPGGADKDVVHPSPPPVSIVQASDVDGTLNISVSIPHEEQDVTATIVTTSLLDNKSVDSKSSDNGEIYPAEVPQQLVTTQTFDFHNDEPLRTGITSAVVAALPGQVNDTTITIDTHPPETQISTAGGERSEVREERRIEVIKSIVYGGLAESLTSLSVVSSAAGGGAATLNVLAMGAANLIGGFFIIFHNLWDLRRDNVEEQLSNQITEQADRYNQLLGRRQNFALHAVVTIISYIVFGLVAPVAYGFSFRESDDKQLKLVVVAAASLLCILVLAVGKAYVQRPPKSYLKTVMTFMIVGILASGVSYAAGGLVERLLEKLGLFEASSAAAPNLLVQEMGTVGSGWTSI